MKTSTKIFLMIIFSFCVQIAFSQTDNDSYAEYLGLIDSYNSFYDYERIVENEAATGDGRKISKLSRNEITLVNKALREYKLQKGEVYSVIVTAENRNLLMCVEIGNFRQIATWSAWEISILKIFGNSAMDFLNSFFN